MLWKLFGAFYVSESPHQGYAAATCGSRLTFDCFLVYRRGSHSDDVKLGADEMMLRERVAASKICGRQTPTTSEAGCYTRLSLLHIASTFASSTASSSRPYRGQNRSSNAKLLRPSTEKAKKKLQGLHRYSVLWAFQLLQFNLML